jgi:hypothetical protein
MRQTGIGRATMIVSIVLGVVALLFMAVCAFVMILGFTVQYLTVLGVVGIALFVAGAGILIFAIAMALQVNGTTAQIHANGLVLGQSWFRKAQVPWAEVVRIDPPTVASTWIRFDLVLRSGQRVCADRLRLKPVGSTAGQVVNHPDVQAVLNHYAAWQQAHGGAWQR